MHARRCMICPRRHERTPRRRHHSTPSPSPAPPFRPCPRAAARCELAAFTSARHTASRAASSKRCGGTDPWVCWKNAQRALRVGPARPACDPAHRTNAGGVPSDRQGSVHSTTPGVNEHPLGASARRDRSRPCCFVRGVAACPAINSGSVRAASGARIDQEAEIDFLGP